jgi:hypothetical protein
MRLSEIRDAVQDAVEALEKAKPGELTDEELGYLKGDLKLGLVTVERLREAAHVNPSVVEGVLCNIAELVKQTRAALRKTDDPEVLDDILHWARGAAASLETGLQEPPA